MRALGDGRVAFAAFRPQGAKASFPYLVWNGFCGVLARSMPEKANLLRVGVGCSHCLPIASHLESMALIIVLPGLILVMAITNDLLWEG